MSKKVSKEDRDALLTGEPIVGRAREDGLMKELEAQLEANGFAAFPYYNQKKKGEHLQYRSYDKRMMLERRVGPFHWTTGEWEHLFNGVPVIIVTTDPTLIKQLTKAGYHMREQDTAAENEMTEGDVEA